MSANQKATPTRCLTVEAMIRQAERRIAKIDRVRAAPPLPEPGAEPEPVQASDVVTPGDKILASLGDDLRPVVADLIEEERNAYLDAVYPGLRPTPKPFVRYLPTALLLKGLDDNKRFPPSSYGIKAYRKSDGSIAYTSSEYERGYEEKRESEEDDTDDND